MKLDWSVRDVVIIGKTPRIKQTVLLGLQHTKADYRIPKDSGHYIKSLSTLSQLPWP
jgi:hypothetical protein